MCCCTRRLYNRPKNWQTQVRQGRSVSLNIASKPHLVILFVRVCSGQVIPCYVAKLRGLPWRAAASNKWRRFSSFGMPFGSMRCGHSTGSKARYVSGRMPQLDHIRDLQWLDQTPIVDRYVIVPLKLAFCINCYGFPMIFLGVICRKHLRNVCLVDSLLIAIIRCTNVF